MRRRGGDDNLTLRRSNESVVDRLVDEAQQAVVVAFHI